MGLDDAARHLADSAESLYRTANEFANTHVSVGVPELDAALSARQAISALKVRVIGDDMAARGRPRPPRNSLSGTREISNSTRGEIVRWGLKRSHGSAPTAPKLFTR